MRLHRHILTLIIVLASFGLNSYAQDEKTRVQGVDVDSLMNSSFSVDSLSNDVIDSYDLKKKKVINDYSMIGFQYGAALTRTYLTPEMAKEDMFLVPVNVGVTFTKYGKMFGYMPYFGIQVGLFYTREGYKFRYDSKKNIVPVFLGAQKAVMDVVEMPVMAHCHVDFWKMKLFLNAGLFLGYRLTIHRYAPEMSGTEGLLYTNLTPSYDALNEEYANKFTDFEKRFDYGVKGGVGFAFVFDPVEIHIQAMYKHSFASLFSADYNSTYYYRYSYQQNIIVSVGLHVQLGKRVGKSKAQIRREAMEFANGGSVNVGEVEVEKSK